MNHSLYPWQEECLALWFKHHGRGIVQAVTGAGKTHLALEAAFRLKQNLTPNVKVKIVVPTGALMKQWEKALRQFLADLPNHQKSANPPEKIGLRGNGCKDRTDCPYMIYVINSARYELARQILHDLNHGEAVLLIADECHHYQSGQNRLIFEFLPYIQPYEAQFFSLGLSATLPQGEGGKYLSSVLGRRIYNYGMEKALSLRTVCPYDIFSVALSFTWEERMEYDELTDKMNRLFNRLIQLSPMLRTAETREYFDILRELSSSKNLRTADLAAAYMLASYQRKKLLCLASGRISCAVSLIRRLPLEEKIIVFGERIQQADELYKHLQTFYPERVGRLHSQMGIQANKNTLERFRMGNIRILISCKAMDEGIDIPDAAVGIILSGTSTQRQRIQRLGRIIRKNQGKARAALYYLYIDNTSEDSCFLPNSKDIRLFELDYRPDSDDFFCLDYHKKAGLLLSRMQQTGIEKEKLQEARCCLQLGSVRADWTRTTEELKSQLETAASAREKNYWNCMKRLREIP